MCRSPDEDANMSAMHSECRLNPNPSIPIPATIPATLAALKSCITSRDIESGMKLHAQVAATPRLATNIYILNSLLDLYSKCHSMADAQRLFDRMPARTVVSWNTMITGYTRAGRAASALALFVAMEQHGCHPNSTTFLAAIGSLASLAGCGDGEITSRMDLLEKAMAVHAHAAGSGCDRDLFVASGLVDLYAKCGSMDDSKRVFDAMGSTRDVVSWTALLSGYVQSGQAEIALESFRRMETEDGVCPNARTFGAAISACAKLAAMAGDDGDEQARAAALEAGRELHSRLAGRGFEADAFVASSLIDMYASCGEMDAARAVFFRMRRRDVVAWNAIILGYARNGDGKGALDLFSAMRREREPSPNARTFVAAIAACAALARKEEPSPDGKKASSFARGAAIHSLVRDLGCARDVFVANSLIDMYCKCGCVDPARRVFDEMEQPNIVSWTSMIAGYADNAAAAAALELYLSAFIRGGCPYKPNPQTFVAAVKACGDLAALETGRQLHEEIRERKLEGNRMLACSLIAFYGKCGDVAAAREVFRSVARKDAAVWSALITAYSFQGDAAGALDLLERMRAEKIEPDSVTLLSVLKACSHAGLVSAGLGCFEEIALPTMEHYACVVDLLGRANRLGQAAAVAESLAARERSRGGSTAAAAVWMTVLAACAKWKDVETGKLAFERIRDMDRGDDAAALVAMANVYSSAERGFT